MTRLIAWFFLVFLTASPLAAAELVYFHERYCPWCEAWDEEIGVLYDKTDEAKVVPLRRVEIDDPRPDDLKHIKPVYYTPTFVVMDKGREVGRITGYPGEEFFWPLLGEILVKLDTDAKPQNAESLHNATKQPQ